MTRRTCPNCGLTSYSADEANDWVCECGAVVGKELSEPAMSKMAKLKLVK